MKKTIHLLLLLCLFCSCNNNLNSTLDLEKQNNEEYFVTIDEVKEIVENLKFRNYPGVKSGVQDEKKIKSIEELKDELGNTFCYNAKYNNGFIILSADRRISPVLAFSEEGVFPENVKDYPDGVKSWLEDIEQQVSYVKSIKVKATNIKDWSKNAIQSKTCPSQTKSTIYEDNYDIKYPLMTTRWNQTGSFNDQIDIQCGLDQAPVGCVAVAMGQIMRYHEYPNTFNWSQMPDGYGTSETCRLLADIGEKVSMDYGCDGSSSKISRCATSLINDYGYANTNYYESFSFTRCKRNIRQGRPVLLRGARSEGWFKYSGHAFVAHGYMFFKYAEEWEDDMLDPEPNFLYINWGWGGYCDGWYANGRWRPFKDIDNDDPDPSYIPSNTSNYSHKRYMVTIYPN